MKYRQIYSNTTLDVRYGGQRKTYNKFLLENWLEEGTKFKGTKCRHHIWET